ncbi:MAG: sulfurtransferase [Armatimonadetes bacterium]|nr:sulfurtransferase [Armatimonadota bacterium]
MGLAEVFLEQYRHPHFPDVLATTSELEALLGSDVVVVEVDVDPVAYDHGHVPGARQWDWAMDLRDPATEEVIDEAGFRVLMERTGIGNGTPVVLYGDNNGWFACWAYWIMKSYGHNDVRILDGGANKWLAERRPLSTDAPSFVPTSYEVQQADHDYQATSTDVMKAMLAPDSSRILDVRSKAEYRGELLGPGVGMPETCAVGGHIPTALNVPWDLNCGADGSFKSPEELKALYAQYGVSGEQSIITYCAIGERASLSWFVLHELLGYEAKNYDRSMSYWSRLPNAPVVEGEAA